MAKIYSKGIVSPKGFDMSAAEPVDQRTVVEFYSDLITLRNCYVGIEVKTADTNYKKYELIALPSSNISNWREVLTGSGDVGPEGPPGPDGADGLSAYEVYIDNGGVLSESNWLISLNGEKGDKGNVGDTGVDGIQGIQGVPGDQGIQGDAGSGVTIQGSDTIANIIIKTGLQGDMWLSTDTGIDDHGTAVVPGDGIVFDGFEWITVGPIRGPEGLQGATGDQGIQGDPGIQGDQGIQGETGLTGADSIVPGPAGPDGYTPIKNVDYFDGVDGADGLKGDTGDTGLQGIQGDTGLTGDTGAAGVDGLDGVDGEGVALGGTVGQILAKIDATDFNTEWIDNSDAAETDPVFEAWKLTPVLAAALNMSDNTINNVSDGVDPGDAVNKSQLDDILNLDFDTLDYTKGIFYRAGWPYIGTSDNAKTYPNMFVGIYSGGDWSTHNSSDGANVGIGTYTLSSLTIGGQNTAVGAGALAYLDTGTWNTGLGGNALFNLADGKSNVAVGRAALPGLTTGDNNVGIGKNAADSVNGNNGPVTSVNNSIYIGADTEASAAIGVTNETVIGFGADGGGSNTVTLGNGAIIKISAGADYTATDNKDLITKGNLDLRLDAIQGETAIGRYDEGAGDTFYPVGYDRTFTGIGGAGALDLSFNNAVGSNSPLQGGIGSQSLTMGYNVTNGGYGGFMIGEESEILSSGTYSIAQGYGNSIGGYSAVGIGTFLQSTSNYTIMMGHSISANSGGGDILFGTALSDDGGGTDKLLIFGQSNLEANLETGFINNNIEAVMGVGTTIGAGDVPFVKDVPMNSMVWFRGAEAGLVTMPQASIANLNTWKATTPKAVATVEYVDSVAGSTGWQTTGTTTVINPIIDGVVKFEGSTTIDNALFVNAIGGNLTNSTSRFYLGNGYGFAHSFSGVENKMGITIGSASRTYDFTEVGLEMPDLTIAEIDAADVKTAPTVEWTLSKIASSGGGDVSKVGTPADNQVGVWTGDGSIEGTTGLTFDGSSLNVVGNQLVTGNITVAVDPTVNTHVGNRSYNDARYLQPTSMIASGGMNMSGTATAYNVQGKGLLRVPAIVDRSTSATITPNAFADNANLNNMNICDSAADITMTLEQHPNFLVTPFQEHFVQKGIGSVIFAAGTGVTFLTAVTTPKTRAQGSTLTAMWVSATEVLITGDLEIN